MNKIVILIFALTLQSMFVNGTEPKLQLNNVMFKVVDDELILYVKEGSLYSDDAKKYFKLENSLSNWISTRDLYLDEFDSRCVDIPSRNVDGYDNDGKYEECNRSNIESGVPFRLEINRLNQFTVFSRMTIENDSLVDVYSFDYEVPVYAICKNDEKNTSLIVQTIACSGRACSGNVYIY